MSLDPLYARFSGEKLLVIINDRLSDLVKKGEITARYYNPGELFKEVHILIVNTPEQLDLDAVQYMVGEAKLQVHFLTPPPFKATGGWRPFLLKSWLKEGVEIAKSIQPQLIRCHGNHLNSFLAREIKRKLKVPYLVSLHINPDEDVRKRSVGWKNWLLTRSTLAIEKKALPEANLVLPVYKPIEPYIKRLKGNYQVAYNVINPSHLVKKTDYSLHAPVRIVSVGRQFKEKNADNLIRAVKRIPNAQLDLIGDGPYHSYLAKLVQDEKLSDRVKLYPSLRNDELCKKLPEYDLFAIHSEYWEINKSLLEALLTGLPCIVNRRKGLQVPELAEGLVKYVDNTVESYLNGLRHLISNDAERIGLGRRAQAAAWEKWDPKKTESNFVSIYTSVLNEAASR